MTLMLVVLHVYKLKLVLQVLDSTIWQRPPFGGVVVLQLSAKKVNTFHLQVSFTSQLVNSC